MGDQDDLLAQVTVVGHWHDSFGDEPIALQECLAKEGFEAMMALDPPAGRPTRTTAASLHDAVLAWLEDSSHLIVLRGQPEPCAGSLLIMGVAVALGKPTLFVDPFAGTPRGAHPLLTNLHGRVLVATGSIRILPSVDAALGLLSLYMRP